MEDAGNSFMPMGNVRKVIAFLQKSNYPVFRAIGGEPTIHPRFGEIVELVLVEGFRIDLFSNATWKPEYNSLFNRISPNRLLFLLNIDHPDNYSQQLWTRIERNLCFLSGRRGVSFSFNIFEQKPRYKYVLDLAEKYQVRAIRMSFSLPVIGIDNACLPLERYKEMTPFIMRFVHECEERGVSVQLDNAVPPCIFDYAQAGELLLKGILDLQRNSYCKPIVDIGPDLSTWYCFCLSKLFHRHLDDFENLEQARSYYRAVVRPYQHQTFPLEECNHCAYRDLWDCQGGCLTFSIEERRGLLPSGIDRPRPAPVAAANRSLGLAPDVQIKDYDLPTKTYVLTKARSQGEMEISPTFKRLIDLIGIERSVGAAVDRFLADGEEPAAATPADRFARDVLAEGVERLVQGLEREGFLELVESA